MQLSSDQEEALDKAAFWLSQAPAPVHDVKLILGEKRNVTIGIAQDYPVFSVGGLAGTGKTTIMREVAERVANVRFVTPTHKAAAVLRSKLPPELKRKVQTYHQLIYLPKPSYTCKLSGLSQKALPAVCGCADGDVCEHAHTFMPCRRHEGTQTNCQPQERLDFEKREFIEGHINLIVVDEASMLQESEVLDIRSYGIPVMLVGDYGQLPPVQGQLSPWIKNPTVTLTVNHRQNEKSGIINAALEARNHGTLYQSGYGSAVRVLGMGDSRVPGLLERFRPDAKESAVLCQFNRTRSLLNTQFHLQYGDKPLNEGERLISLQRIDNATVIDPETGDAEGETRIYNGTLCTVKRVDRITERFIYALVELDNDWQGKQGVHVVLKLAAEQLGRPDKLPLDRKPRDAALLDYAYCLTGHKAQGSEMNNVIVIQERTGDKRWLYTCVTRSKKALIVIRP